MPSIVRKLHIYAVVDGLVLQPLVQKGQRPTPAVKIAYKGGSIGPVLVDGIGVAQGKTFEAFGIVGLLTVSSSSYLISITRRQVIAQIRGKSVYVITEVALTPLSSKKEAEAAIARTQTGLKKGAVDRRDLDNSDADEEEGDFSASDDIEDDETLPLEASNRSIDGTLKDADRKSATSVAEDVIAKKGGYGRFAQNWFSRAGWTAGQRRNLGLSTADADAVTGVQAEPTVPNGLQKLDISGHPAPTIESEALQLSGERDVAVTLLPKLLRTTSLLFGSSRSFFFSYDYDITRSVTNRRPPNGSDTPLYKQVDPLFFWNRHITQPFIDAGQSSLVLPLMQGFVGQRAFVVDKHPAVNLDSCLKCEPSSVIEMKELSSDDEYERSSQSTATTATDGNKFSEPSPNFDGSSQNKNNTTWRRSIPVDSTRSYLLTLISRRSVKRSGLRYLRRGVDDEGNTANTVETEQILSSSDWSQSSKTYSFLQVRGSIPLFFSQSPYSFKPIPQMQQSAETNFQALNAHFSNLSSRYGSLHIASLVEKHNTEAQVGEEFEKNMARLNESGGINGRKVGFEWFDFHAMCRGMKFENVSLLLDTLGPVLDSFGTSIEVSGVLINRQSGILRTNCMDCLDRTNVAQSACGRRALEIQLRDQDIDLSAQVDQVQQWFNTLWADNGDAISKQYASTAAMKGDFTRTRKRNYKGALTDMGISIARFYSGIVNDYFSQAAMDFLLGNVTFLVFEYFEANMMSTDPVVSMQKMRQQAIDVSQRLIVADQSEELVGGWALLTPRQPNTIKSMPFEESVLLLTDVALYACRFDWNMEKVLSFERVDLRHIIGIKYGTYITSTLSPAQAGERRNVGLVITYKAGANDIERVNTRSLSTAPSLEGPDPSQGSSVSPSLSGLLAAVQPNKNPNRIVALKALPTRSAVATTEVQNGLQMSEMEQVKLVCSEIERLVVAGQVIETGMEGKSILEEGDIISLAEARRSTGLLEHLGHSLKKLVWA